MRAIRILVAATAVLCLAAAAFGQALEIHHLDVGQGDATLIVGLDGTVMLIDGGDNGRGNNVVLPYLDRLGINRIDYIVATHMDADHIGGLDEVMEGGLEIGEVLDNGSSASTVSYADYVAAAAAHSAGRRTIAVGEAIDLGDGATATCIYRNGRGTGGTISVSDENDRSVVLVIDFDDFQYFIGGDIGGGLTGHKDVESFVAPSVGDVDVLRVNHHGSSGSSNNKFLGELSPEAAIISVGHNSYGHPDAGALARLYGAGCDVMQTGGGANPGGKVMGNIKIVVKKGKFYWVNGSKRWKDEFIKKGNQSPSADFTGRVTGRSVDLDAALCRDDGKIRHYFWNFGDGEIMSGPRYCKVAHAYTGEGQKTVFLSVLDKFGISATTRHSYIVGEIRSINVSAYASPSSPKRYSHVKVYCTVTDQLDRPVNGVSITTTANYKTTKTTLYGITGSNGTCYTDYYIGPATAGYYVRVDVTATYGKLKATTTTGYTPW
jgi:beta-lactamase superfamily II metal-dependent hydrolase